MQLHPFYNFFPPADGGGTPPPTPPTPPAGETPPPTPPAEKEEDKKEEEEADLFAVFNQELGEVEGQFEQSAKGVVAYVKAHKAKAEKEFIDYLNENHPNVFKAYVHEMNGGSITDLFKPDKQLPFNSAPKAEDIDAHKAIIRYDLESKGLSKEIVDMTIASMIDKGTIAKYGTDTFNALQKAEEQRIEQTLIQQAKAKEEAIRKDTAFVGKVHNYIKGGKLGSFVINDKDAPKFSEYITKNIHYDGNGGYAVNLPINDDSAMQKVTQALYFLYREGDLSKYVDKKAEAKAVEKIFKNAAPASAGANKPEFKGFFPK